MSAVDKIKRLRALRQIAIFKINQIQQISNRVIADIDLLPNFIVACRDLQQIRDEFEKSHIDLINVIAVRDDGDLDAEEAIRAEFMAKVIQVEAMYYELHEKPNQEKKTNTSTQNNVKLPKLELLHFAGDVKQFPTFLGMFDSLVNNNQKLSDIEKFNYLLSVLKGNPLSLVKRTPLIGCNYEVAYNSLVERYSNKRSLATAYWKELSNSPRLTTENAQALRNLLDIFAENLSALKKLDYHTEQWDFVMMNLLLDRLDSSTIKAFELHHASNEVPTYENLYAFLQKRCIALEAISVSSYKKNNASSSTTNILRNPRNTASMPNHNFRNQSVLLANAAKPTCAFCTSDHVIFKCNAFLLKTPKERFDFVKANKYCINCLATSHLTYNCTSEKKCHKCQKHHHTLLHFDTSSNQQQNNTHLDAIPGPSNVILNATTKGSDNESPTSLSSIISTQHNILLATALVHIRDKFGNLHIIRTILDSGSQVSCITRACANKLGLSKFNIALAIQGLDKMSTPANSGIHCSISPIDNTNQLIDVNAIILDKICTEVPNTKFSYEDWSHISTLKLADIDFNIPGKIDLLLGADIFPYILENGRIISGHDQPIALNTIFGWVIMGRVTCSMSPKIKTILCSITDENLDTTLKQFWQIEEVPDVKVSSPENIECDNYFLNTTYRNREGRFVVSLPFRRHNIDLGDTRSLAMSRLYALERRFARNESLRIDYCNFMRDYLDCGHMSQILTPNVHDNAYYMPHHCVIKKDSTTTPLRVVFDASSHAPNRLSLNDALFTGPKLQNDIIKMLLNFRLHKVVFTADIKQMYRQILVTPEHRQFQRILWRFSPSEPVLDYELNTVTFGVVCAPYLAIRTLLHLAEVEKDFPLASKILTSESYVDDIVSGSDSLENAIQCKNQLIQLLKKGGFELRKWSSNELALLSDLPEENIQTKSFSFDLEDNKTVKILGLQWSWQTDSFFYSIQPLNVTCTKRNILSQIARIFDPLGFLNPVTLFAKLLIQQLWSLNLNWDDVPPDYILNKWEKFKNELTLLSDFKLLRHIDIQNCFTCELHGFCDGSEQGYCAVIYLRITYTSNEIKTFFTCAKCKVAPLKRLTVPRLELCAAVLLSKLITFVLHTFENKIHFDNIFAWSDSSVVLSWIKSSPHKWKTFVSNRVSYVQERVDPKCWMYIPSKANPADCGSRGLLPSELINTSAWWVGPSFLRESSEFWELSDVSNLQCTEEDRKHTFSTFISVEFIDTLLDRFSSLSKIKRIIAYILRFIHNLKNPQNRKLGYLTLNDLNQALMIIIKRIQCVYLHLEIKQVSQKKTSKILRKLNPFFDKDNILRVGGRLSQASISYDKRFPILLPSNCKFTSLLILEMHKSFLHPGIQTTHFLLSQNFWIFSAKKVIKKVLSKCKECWKTNPIPYQPPMGALPTFRISQIKPFSQVCIDMGGPFTITMGKLRGSKTTKAYLCLFVCCATKALHLELTSDLSTEAFLAALRRFIARRGRCNTIYSDCGTNFVGANKYLIQIMHSAAQTEALQWKFNPPSAPHFNGLAESGIKAVKTHLRRVIGEQILTYEELNTILIQVEAILNSRPLCAVSNDPNDLSVLTPGHFLTLEPMTTLPDPDLSDIHINKLSRWQLLQRLHFDFWKRWHQEYLHTLQQRGKWHNLQKTPEIGTLVLIKNELLTPLNWERGRITQLHPGVDGVARVATVKTTKGEFKRPLVKLCPLSFAE